MTRICDACNEETDAKLTDSRDNDFCKSCYKEIYGIDKRKSILRPTDTPRPKPFVDKPDFWLKPQTKHL